MEDSNLLSELCTQSSHVNTTDRKQGVKQNQHVIVTEHEAAQEETCAHYGVSDETSDRETEAKDSNKTSFLEDCTETQVTIFMNNYQERLHQENLIPDDTLQAAEIVNYRNCQDEPVDLLNNHVTVVNFDDSLTPASATDHLLSFQEINSEDLCRICHCEAEEMSPLITPCMCTGSLKYVHTTCLQQWIKSSDIRSCELCNYLFQMKTKTKPLWEWQMLRLSGLEYRRLLCSVSFHLVAVTCVIWSLYVLIDRTVQELAAGQLEWPFWTKLVVLAIGFTGGMVFMYVQCKTYYVLFRRWRCYNRTFMVRNATFPVSRSDDSEDSKVESVRNWSAQSGEKPAANGLFRERMYTR